MRSGRATESERLVLITGATGYVGGRLLNTLEERGQRVRCLARRPEQLVSRAAPSTEVMRGDAVTGDGLGEALSGVDTAFYLIHSMEAQSGFEERDRQAAVNFGNAAHAAGVRRIVYLGGLADERYELSPHLRSRVEVGRLLRSSGVPVIELRASIVIGSGSLSFEMIRALVEHLPVLVTPRWVSVAAQPIGIDDLTAYLVESLDADPAGNPVYEIGGADRVSYGDLMHEYARQRGLRRWMLRVPVLTPRLSSLWLALVTPLYARVGRKLIDSIRHPTIVEDESARSVFSVEPSDVRTAIARAIGDDDLHRRQLVDSREVRVELDCARAFQPIRRIGGDSGWYAYDSLWQLRGFIDRLLGGVGMSRGRRDPDRLAVGEALDCWRVVRFEPDRLLRLNAEMRLPGNAWLQFEVRPDGDGALIRQTATFEPSGLGGLLYWYGIYPLHSLVFGGMLRGIARRAASSTRAPGGKPWLAM